MSYEGEMTWVVEFESWLDPGTWIRIRDAKFRREEDAWASLVKYIFEVPDRRFRVRKEMKNDQN